VRLREAVSVCGVVRSPDRGLMRPRKEISQTLAAAHSRIFAERLGPVAELDVTADLVYLGQATGLGVLTIICVTAPGVLGGTLRLPFLSPC
jgi:hypothetical protein